MNKVLSTPVIKKQYPILIIIVISLLIITGGYMYYNYSAKIKLTEAKNELLAISQLKISQIENWHNERIANAITISEDPLFKDGIQKWLKDKNNKSINMSMRQKLSSIQNVYGYHEIFITSLNEKILLSADSDLDSLDKETSIRIAETVKTKKIEDTDFYYCKTHNAIHYDVIAPLFNEKNKVIAAIVLRIKPEDYIYPLIQDWPLPTKSGETLLIRKKGNSALFLNNLRFKKNTALKLEIPLTEKEVPAVQAILGYKGIWEGKDYRNVEVLSYINAVPGTNWFMITKVDEVEILKDLQFVESAVILFVVLILIALALGISWLYHFRQRNLYRELFQSNEEFKTILYSIGDAVITTDNEGKVQHLNSVAEKLTGWSLAEAKDRALEKIFKIVYEETRRKAENPIRKILAEGLVIELANNTILISKDGTETPISDSGAPIRNEKGNIIGVVLVFRDQSMERKVRKVLIESETKYRGLFESAKDGILILNAETGKIVDVNPSILNLLGYPRDYFLHKAIWEISSFRDIVSNREKFYELQNQDDARYNNLSLETSGGQKIIVEFVSNLYSLNNKKVIQCNIHNITEQKIAEEALQASIRINEGIINSIPVRVFWKDKNLVYLGCNNVFAHDAGFKDPKEIIGKDDFQMGWHEQAEAYRTDDRNVIESGKSKYLIEETQTTPDGKTITLLTSKIPLLDFAGKIIGILGTYFDITERKKAEETLETNEKFLRETQKIAQLGSYILNISTGTWKSSEILDSIFGIDKDSDKSVQGWTTIIHPDYRQEISNYLTKEVIGLRKKFDKEYKIIRKDDQSVRWVHGLGELVLNKVNQPVQLVGTVRDITERKNAEMEIAKLNRVYALLSNTNKAIVRIQGKQKLFDEICRVAIESGKFRMAWIGIVNQRNNKLDIVASSGVIENYLEKINIDLNDPIRSQGPAGRALKIGRHFISNDIENDVNMIPWKENALRLGYKSSASFPLKVFGKITGAFTLYSNQKDFFQDHEKRLLDEMAMDISFALEFIETEKKRKATEEILRRNEALLRIAGEAAKLGGWNINLSENSVTWSEEVVKIHEVEVGFKPGIEDLINYTAPEYRDKMNEVYTACITDGKPYDEEIQIITAKGNRVWIRGIGAPEYDKAKKIIGVRGAIQDITGLKYTEKELIESETRFRSFFEDDLTGDYITTPDGKFLLCNDALANMFGFDSARQMRYKNITEFYKDKNSGDEIIRLIRENKKLFRYERDFIRGDGKEISVIENIFGEFDEVDELISIKGYLFDITERKQAEKLAEVLYRISQAIYLTENIDEFYKQIHQNLLSIIPASNFFIALVSNDEKKLYLPFNRDEKDGDELWSIDADDPGSLTVEVLKSKRPLLLNEKELNDRYSSGKSKVWGTRPKCWLGVPLILKEKVIGVIAVQDYKRDAVFNLKDVSLLESAAGQIAVAIDRKLAEDEIITLAHSLRSIQECVSITDMDNKILFVNQSFIKTYGYSKDELIGKDISIVRSPNNPPIFANEILPATLQEGWNGELWNKRKDGSEFQIYLSTTKIKDKTGKLLGLIGIATDLTERKVLETNLSTAAEIAKLGYWEYDIDQRNFIFSDNYFKLVHGSSYEKRGRIVMSVEEYIRKYVVPDDSVRVGKSLRDAIQSADPNYFVNTEGRIFKENGEIAIISIQIRVLKDSSGKTYKVYGVNQDITDRKRAQEALVESEERLSTIINTSIEGICSADINENIIFTNPRFAEMTGYTIEELKEKNFRQLVPADDLENHLTRMSLRKSGGSEISERRLLKKDGSIFWALISATAIKDIDAGYIGSFGMFADITEQKLAEEEIRKLSRGIEQSPASVVITDLNGDIEYVNSKFCQISGYNYDEIIGKNPRILQSGETRKEDYAELWNSILNGKDWKGEFHNKKKNGELYWESASISSILNEEGKITHFIGIKEDITEDKKMIAELIVAKERAEDINRLKSNFLANMSHELRTPLVGILGYSDFLRQDVKSPELKEMAETIFKSGQRLLETLNLILDLSQLETDKRDIEYQKIDLITITNEVIDLFKRSFPKKGIIFKSFI